VLHEAVAKRRAVSFMLEGFAPIAEPHGLIDGEQHDD